ncbi:hypothetical protein Droror1_Dr00027946, partial [Drosera rotundifolia]
MSSQPTTAPAMPTRFGQGSDRPEQQAQQRRAPNDRARTTSPTVWPDLGSASPIGS